MFCIECWTVRKSELQLNTEAEESYKVQHRDVMIIFMLNAHYAKRPASELGGLLLCKER